MAPMLTCSNNARTKVNCTRGLIISAHQIGLAQYRQSVDSTDVSSAKVAIYGDHLILGIWKLLSDIHIHKPLSYSLPDIVLFLLHFFCNWIKTTDLFIGWHINSTLPQVYNVCHN